MLPFYDAHFIAPEYVLSETPALPEELAGAVLFGPEAKARRDEFFRWAPERKWRHAEELQRVVGESNAAFPSRSAQVIHLRLEAARLMEWLKRPAEWWPLCEALRGTRRVLRIVLPAGVQPLIGAKRLVRRFPETFFWFDPFVHGPAPGWQGHVRLAEHENVILTTLGLHPGEASPWPEAAAREALRFAVGEVGAGVLLYASGLRWDDLAAGRDRPFREWLEQSPELAGEEGPLVLGENAVDLFGATDPTASGLP